MRIHFFQHVPFETPGMILAWAGEQGHSVSHTHFYAPGSVMPLPEEYDMLVILGGPMSVHDEQQHPWLAPEKKHIKAAIAADKTIVGICLGAQLIACVLGAKVYPNHVKEIGWFPIAIEDNALVHPLLAGWNSSMAAFHWHGETFDIPAGAVHLMSSAACRNQAFLYAGRVLGLQFHLEMGENEIEQILQHCGAELVPCATIQTAEIIRAKSSAVHAAKRALFQVLNHLVHN